MSVTAAHRCRISQQAKLLFVEIGLNYSADCAGVCNGFRFEMSNFLLLALAQICLLACRGCEHILDLLRELRATVFRIHLFPTWRWTLMLVGIVRARFSGFITRGTCVGVSKCIRDACKLLRSCGAHKAWLYISSVLIEIHIFIQCTRNVRAGKRRYARIILIEIFSKVGKMSTLVRIFRTIYN